MRLHLRLVHAALLFICVLSSDVGRASLDDDPWSPNGGSDLDLPPPQPGVPEGSVLRAAAGRAPIHIQGTGAVTDAGQATYTIPIQVPDGPAGMQPGLSIGYGGDGNGLLGVGMGLSGLSVIAPCSQTWASDGHADGVDFDSTDAYCLDGNKLVATTGENHRVYRTEIETYQRITGEFPYFEAPQPISFTVEARDGRVLTYMPLHSAKLTGVDGAHRPTVGDSVAVVYPLTSIVDQAGNEIVYTYEEESASPVELSYRIDRIAYSFTSGGVARRWLDFVYDEARPDPIVRNVAGVQTIHRSRLERIEAHAPNPDATQKVWEYRLDYTESADTGRSLLSTVRQCDQFGDCSWEKRFEWTTPDAEYKQATLLDQELSAAALSQDEGSYLALLDMVGPYSDAFENNFYAPTDVRILVFDVDGDGRDDALYRTAPTRHRHVSDGYEEGSTAYTKMAYMRERGRIFVRRSTDAASLSDKLEVTDLFEPGATTAPGWVAHLGKSRVADLDLDGVPDLLLARTQVEQTGEWWPTAISEGSPVFHDRWTFGYTRFLGYPWGPPAGDGIDDVSIYGPVFRGVKVEQPLPGWYDKVDLYSLFVPPFQRVLADLDGDGRMDDVDAFRDVDLSAPALLDADWGNHGRHYQRYLARLMPSNAAEVAEPQWRIFTQSWTCGNGRMQVSDLDQDGRADILAATDDQAAGNGVLGLYRRLSLMDPSGGDTGDVQIDAYSNVAVGDCGLHDPDVVLGDFNGDGLDDVLRLPDLATDVEPKIRWNLGNGFTEEQILPVDGPNGALNQLLYQRQPNGHDGLPVGWDRGTRVADVNGDGLADVVAYRLDAADCLDSEVFYGCSTFNTVLAVYRSVPDDTSPSGFRFVGEVIDTWAKSGVSLAHGFSTAQVGDVNGDGALDLVHVVDGVIRVGYLRWRNQGDKLAKVWDGGVVHPLEAFAYTRDWWGDGQRPDPTGSCAYPLSCSRKGATVVRTHTSFVGTQANGLPMLRERRHTFANPKADMRGRGSLGFAEHRIWDVGLGAETIRFFDNETPLDQNVGTASDPEGGAYGGEFYPYAGRLSRQITITPIAPRPTQAELDAGDLMPGLDGDAGVEVRVTETTQTYEVRPDPPETGIVLAVFHTGSQTNEYETSALAQVTTETPSYVWYNQNAPLRSRSGTFVYDEEHGNLLHESTQTEDGVYRETAYEYENRVDTDWILGLQTQMRTTSYVPPLQAGQQVGHRIVRSTYDEIGLLETTHASAEAWLSCSVLDPEDCEEEGTTATYERDARGLIRRITEVAADEPSPRVARYYHDAEGVYRYAVRNGLGHTAISLLHPALGVPVLAVDANGVVATVTYDGFGRVLQASRAGTATETRSRTTFVSGNRRGVITRTTSEDGGASEVTTDELGRPIASKVLGFADGQEIASAREYDAFGSVSRAYRPSFGAPSAYFETATFDRLGRMLTATGPDGATTTYVHTMFDTHAWDPEGDETYTVRDKDDRVVESGHVVDGEPYGEVAFTYTAFDQVETVTDAYGHKTVIGYTGLGRRQFLADPDAGLSSFAYNGFGQLVSEVNAIGEARSHEHDLLGRSTLSTGPDGDSTLTWDAGPYARGQLVASHSPDDITVAIAYDSLGRIKETSRDVDGATYRVTRKYDDFGRPARLFYPETPDRPRFAIDYDYNERGYLQSIHDITACGLDAEDATNSEEAVPGSGGIDPHPDVEGGGGVDPHPGVLCANALWTVQGRNAEQSLTVGQFGNGAQVVRSYETVTGRLSEVEVPAADFWFSYDYNDDGNVETRSDLANGRLETFGYDPLHRLTGWTLQEILEQGDPKEGTAAILGALHDTSYAYDELGNLESIEVDGASTFHGGYGGQGKPHALDWMQDGGTQTTFLYDGLGRQTEAYPAGAADRIVTYSQYDLPRTVTNAAGVTTFMFDAGGARARKIGPDGTTATVYVEGVYERRVGAEGDTHVHYVSSPDDGLVAQFHDDRAASSAAMLYHVTDPLQSVALVLDEAGAEVERTLYDPFGARVNGNGEPAADGDPRVTLGFTGHEHDDDLGLVNMRGRIYDPAQRRFLTPDPLVSHPLFGQSYNPYSYVLNNPVNLTDPSGYQSTAADQQQRRADANDTRLDAKGATDGATIEVPDEVIYCSSGADNIGRCGPIGPPVAAPAKIAADGAGGRGTKPPQPPPPPPRPQPSPERRLLNGYLRGMGVPSSRAEGREALGNAAQAVLDNPAALLVDPTMPFRMAYGLGKTVIEAPIHLGAAAAAASNGDMNAVADEAGAAIAGFVQLGMTAANVKLHMGQQGKHIPGHNNFIRGRSVLRADPARLARKAGTGAPVGKTPRGQPGFKERVDFGEVIGEFVEDGVATPTTIGILHYGEKGIHIVPAAP